MFLSPLVRQDVTRYKWRGQIAVAVGGLDMALVLQSSTAMKPQILLSPV